MVPEFEIGLEAENREINEKKQVGEKYTFFIVCTLFVELWYIRFFL